jgi:hypothetical protein
LSEAFHKAWAFVENDHALEVIDVSQRRSALAYCLLTMANQGETDVTRLANGAIMSLRREAQVVLMRRNAVSSEFSRSQIALTAA